MANKFRKCENYWSGEGGDEYLRRCRVRWANRKAFWEMMLDVTMARSVFEFGCNAGWNLSAIRRAYPDVFTTGYDINLKALEQAWYVGHEVSDDILQFTIKAELAFTAGVLIHIPAEDLESTMKNVMDKSCDWVLAIEYPSDEEEEIEYQGQKGLLWKRDYGKLYQDLGLNLISQGMASGFDDCKYWLLRHPGHWDEM